MTFRLDRATEILARTPTVLRALLDGLSDAWLEADEGPDTFSPRDVVAHLVQGEEEDWIPRLRIILDHGERRPFEPFDRFAFRARYADEDVSTLLDRFAALRRENLETLASLDLSPDVLERRGTHPELGTVTLGQLLATWVVHDLGHVAQMTRVMAKEWREEVGAWVAYLPVLQR